jgi:dTDP-4-dehydrorhamnose 3,5-epimerase
MTQRPRPAERWILTGERDRQSVTPDWRAVVPPTIAGVMLKEVAPVPTLDGYVSELLRAEWLGENTTVGQVFQRVLAPGAVSAWHAHAVTTDRFFCVLGQLLIVLYDGRADSPTVEQVSKHLVGPVRPALLIIPPGVWHGIRNVSSDTAVLINMVDIAYDYAEPDHWRLPPDSPSIPHRW